MPAKSKAQQKFMGIVRSIQKGEQPASKFSKKAQDAAKDMKKKDAEDFASTKHKGLPKKVKEAFLSENPAASAAAAMVMMQMQNPDTGKKIKAITPLKNKDHKLHGKAKGIFKRLKDKFSKKKDKPVDKVAQYRALMQKEVEEGFGGDLKGSDKKKFEKARKENAEVLGYELTGTKDIKEGKKAVKAYKEMGSAITTAIYGVKNFRKIINDGPYDKKLDKITGELYKLEIDLEKKLRLLIPQMKKISADKRLESVNEAGLEMNKLKDAIKMFQKKIKKQGRVTNARDEEHLKNLIKVYKQMGGKGVKEAVIKVSKKDDIPGNPMKMKGEEKIKKLAWSGSVGMKKPGSYEIKGNKLNVNNIRPRDKGFFVRHFTMGTGFRKANLYYDGVHWQGKKKF